MRVFVALVLGLAFLSGCSKPEPVAATGIHFGSVYKPDHFYIEFLPVCFGPEVERVLAGRPLNAAWKEVVLAVNNGQVPTPNPSQSFRITLRGVDTKLPALTVVDRYERITGNAVLQTTGPDTVQMLAPLQRFGLETPKTFWTGGEPVMELNADGYQFYYRGTWVHQIRSTDDRADLLRLMLQTQPAYMTVFIVRC